MDVVAGHGCHLAPLHFGNALVRMQDKDIDVLRAPAALDRGGAGITGGRTEHHHPFIATRQGAFQQPAEQLQREILERQCRAMEQFEQPLVVPELHQRRDRGVTEIRIGLGGNGTQFGGLEKALHEGLHDLGGEFGIAKRSPAQELRGLEARQRLGYVESAIGRQSGAMKFGVLVSTLLVLAMGLFPGWLMSLCSAAKF